MGKKLDAFLGRGFKTKKFQAKLNLAISRLTVLKNQHQSRYSIARSDVIQMLQLGHHERALYRVDQVIKEQNLLDVFAMIETYCHLLKERVDLLIHAKDCPEELKEAISSMVYAACRCGQFPELQELRAVYATRFGKEFVARAVELRNNCGVCPKMIQRLSTRMPTMQNRMKMLKEIAAEKNVVLQIEEADSVSEEVKKGGAKKQNQTEMNPSIDAEESGTELGEVGTIEEHSYSMKTRRKYKDVAHAAQAAFESAASATEAARAVLELSRADSHDSDDPRNSSPQSGKMEVSPLLIEGIPQTSDGKDFKLIDWDDLNIGLVTKDIHLDENYHSESGDDEMHSESELEEIKQNDRDKGAKSYLSPSSMDVGEASLSPSSVDAGEDISSSDERKTQLEETNIVFDKCDNGIKQ